MCWGLKKKKSWCGFKQLLCKAVKQYFSFAFKNFLWRLWKGKSGFCQRATTCSSKPSHHLSMSEPTRNHVNPVMVVRKVKVLKAVQLWWEGVLVPSIRHRSPAWPNSRGLCFPSLALLTTVALQPLPCSCSILLSMDSDTYLLWMFYGNKTSILVLPESISRPSIGFERIWAESWAASMCSAC